MAVISIASTGIAVFAMAATLFLPGSKTMWS